MLKMCVLRSHSFNMTILMCICDYIKKMKMVGPPGLNGLTVPSPVDVEGSKGDDPAMASCRPVLARQFKPAAAR